MFLCSAAFHCLCADSCHLSAQALGELECGVCCNCQLDCRQLVLSLKVVDDVAKRRSLILKAAPAFADHSKL